MPGFNKPLYVLPFDHRGSFAKGLLGVSTGLTPEQTAEIASYKTVVYDGFLAALEGGVEKAKAGVLVDEQFGAAIARDARKRGLATAMPAEKSGQDEFDFEYGDAFGDHIRDFDVTFCKVLVRCNPEGDAEANARQNERLARLGKFLAEDGRLYMFELLVPAEPHQIEALGGDKSRYDVELRPKLMVDAVRQIHAAGINPDVWKIEGISDPDECKKLVEAVREDGNDDVGCIVLGRGENEAKVVEWLSAASGVEGYIGFAVGRTTFWSALTALQAKTCTRDEAVATIASNYRKFVNLFENA